MGRTADFGCCERAHSPLRRDVPDGWGPTVRAPSLRAWAIPARQRATDQCPPAQGGAGRLLLVLLPLFSETSSCRVAHGEDVDDAAIDHKEDPVDAPALAEQEHPDLAAMGIRVDVDRAPLWIGLEGVYLRPNVLGPLERLRPRLRLFQDEAGRFSNVSLGAGLDDDPVDHSTPSWRSSFSNSSKTTSAGRPSPRLIEARPSCTASMVSSRSASSRSLC